MQEQNRTPLKIQISIPSYRGFNCNELTRSLMQLVTIPTDPVIDWTISFSRNCPVLPRVRNSLAAAAVATNCTHILFIDDDIGFAPEDVLRMIGHDVGFVAAVPQKRNTKWDQEAAMAVFPGGLEVDRACGLAVPPKPKAPMALTLIKTDVFKRIAEATWPNGEPLARRFVYPHGPRDAQAWMRMYFGYELEPSPEWSEEYKLAKELGWADEDIQSEDGEDHYFCRRVAAIGEPIYLDVNAELVHFEGNVAHDFSLKKLMNSDKVVLKQREAA